jgi:hypothetical protein
LKIVRYKIDYHYYDYNHSKKYSNKTITLPELFSIISTEMMDVIITESRISDAIKKHVFSTTNDYYFSDDQFIKRILNQFKALGLLYSSWSSENTNLYWGLTPKGQKARDDMILIRNTDII